MRRWDPARLRAAGTRNARVPPWRAEEDAELRRGWLAGEPASAIGRRLGRSKCAVVNRAHRLGLPGRPSPLGPKRPKGPAQVAAATGRGCAWPLWPHGAGPKHPLFGRFCGRPVCRGSYCAEHAALAFTPPERKRDTP